MPGRGKSKKWWSGYHKMRNKGMSKSTAARIMNSRKKRKRKR